MQNKNIIAVHFGDRILLYSRCTFQIEIRCSFFLLDIAYVILHILLAGQIRMAIVHSATFTVRFSLLDSKTSKQKNTVNSINRTTVSICLHFGAVLAIPSIFVDIQATVHVMLLAEVCKTVAERFAAVLYFLRLQPVNLQNRTVTVEAMKSTPLHKI